jgi:hypothetical protein
MTNVEHLLSFPMAGSGPKPTGAGGAAQPCCAASPNRGGRGADGWAPATMEGGGS